MARKIRIGVIGLGRIGWQFHCRELAAHADFELIAVADPLEERREEAERTYGCRSLTRHEDLLDVPQLEAVVVAAPTHLHKPMALAAFRRGLHVYMEKPLASNVGQAEAIVRAAARKRGLVLSVYQPHRASAGFQTLLRLMASGEIGEPYEIRFGRYGCVRRDDWQSLRRFGGGMLNNYGAHYLDVALQTMGYDVGRVFCQLRRVLSLGDAEDVVRIVLEMRSGRLAEIDINQALAITPVELEVRGSRGAITLSEGAYTVRSFRSEELAPRSLDTSLASSGRQYPRERIEFHERVVPVDPALAVDVYADLARSIRRGTEPFVRPREALAVMRLIDRCRRDSKRIAVT